MIFSSFANALAQLGDRRFQKVLVLGLGLTILLLAAMTWGFIFLANLFVPETVSLPFVGDVTWLRTLTSGLTVVGMLGASVFLMVPVASAFTSLFLEEIADAVEDRYYADLAPAEATPWGTALRDTVNFLGVIIAANLAALVLYVIFTPLAPLIFWSLNGFLLGREYFQITAMRRLGRKGAAEMRSRHFTTIWIAGTLMAMPLTVPVINLLVPVIGAATFTHLFHKLRERDMQTT